MISLSRSKLTAAVVLVALLSFGAGALAQSRYPAMDNAEAALQSEVEKLQYAGPEGPPSP